MSVFLLGSADETCGWMETAADTVKRADISATSLVAGATTNDSDPGHIIFDAGAMDATQRVIEAMEPSTTIVLVSSAVPLNLIEAAYATPVGQASRKIIDIGEPQADDAVVAALFQIADMLIFTPYAFAAALKLEVVPTSVEQLLPVQSRIARHNQGVVVRFPGHGAAAVWADRFIFVEKTEDRNLAGSRARFSGTIAAAVAQKIGPEPALVMALAEVDVAG